MDATGSGGLAAKKCLPCEGGVPRLSREEADMLGRETPGWKVNGEATKIERSWVFRNFEEALAFVNEAGRIAEEEQHHPDLHLTGYRNVSVEIWTHAIGGLSENDFILAAKIDRMPTGRKD